jgi:hypothetical protein
VVLCRSFGEFCCRGRSFQPLTQSLNAFTSRHLNHDSNIKVFGINNLTCPLLNKHLPSQTVNQQVDPALPVCRIKPSKCSLIVGGGERRAFDRASAAMRLGRCEMLQGVCNEGRSGSAVVVVVLLFLYCIST